MGGPVGSGKTALVERAVQDDARRLRHRRRHQRHLHQGGRRVSTRAGALEPDRIVGVETGGCPHTAIREDASINLAAVSDIVRKWPKLEIVFVESGGDNLAATFSPELADLTIYVIDVAAGEKIPRKGGPGITRSRPAGDQQDRPRAAWSAPTSTSWTAMRGGCAAPGRSCSPTSRRTRAWPRSRLSSCARAACRPADDAGAAADFAGIKLPLVEAVLPMPVFQSGDLIIGELPATAAFRSCRWVWLERLDGRDDDSERRSSRPAAIYWGSR